MVRFSATLSVTALLFFFSAFGNEIQQTAGPMTHLVISNKPYTNIHTNVQRLKGVYFFAKVVGKFEKIGGEGWYNGSFPSSKSANKRKATFGYEVGGKVNGKMSAHSKWARVHAGYEASARDTLHGQTVKSSVKRNAVFTAERKKFFYRERGTIRMSLGGKLIAAKYFATVGKKAETSISSAVASVAMASVAVAANANMLPISELICRREGCASTAVSIRSIRSSTWFRITILVYALWIPSTVTAVPVMRTVTEHVPDAIWSNWVSFLIIGVVVLVLLCFGVNGDYDFGPRYRGRFNFWMGPRDTHSTERFTFAEKASPRLRRTTSVPR